MKRYISLLALALLASIGLIAQQGAGPVPHGPGGNGPGPEGPDGPRMGMKLTKCLTILDLTEDQMTQIQGVLESAKPQIEAIHESAREDHEALQEAIESGADACTVGEALLAVHENREEIEALREQIRDDIFALLTAEQQAKLSGCLQAPGRERGVSRGPRG